MKWTIVVKIDFTKGTRKYEVRREGDFLAQYDSLDPLLVVMKIQQDNDPEFSAHIWRRDIQGPAHDERLYIYTRDFDHLKEFLQYEHRRN